MAYDAELAGRVRERLASEPGFSEKKMFGGLCFLLNGNMCCGINGDDLMLRVRAEDYEALLRRPGVRPMDFTGRPLRGMLYVASESLSSAPSLQRWLDRATRFVENLPPRSPRKKEASSRKARR
jgi:TfoX/Sxy family transcriptional regulator of competence genes